MDEGFAIAHYVSLAELGGVERQFRAFARRAARRPGVRQAAVICSQTVHPENRSALARLYDHRVEKSIAGRRLPHRPRWLRAARQGWIGRHQNAAVALLWNRLGQQGRAIDALGAARCLYWEHGSAWLHGEDRAKRAVLARLPALICNSRAARRMLELRWAYPGVIRVCPNGVAASPTARTRGLDSTRPLRLGMAGRLVPIKAVCIGLHTLAALRGLGIDAELAIAGDGPLRDELVTRARRLGIASSVCFRGAVADMHGFFDAIDLLLHTALREPFGMVAAEAQAAGVPVVCTAVDGLPEVVGDGETGRCVAPRGDLARYVELGGHNDHLPPVVYAPDRDRVVAPRICEPADLARAVRDVVAEPARYTAMSTAACQRVARRFDLDAHVDDVLAAAREYAATATLEPIT